MLRTVHILLFDDVTPLDFVGPAEVFARLQDHYTIRYFSFEKTEINAATGLLLSVLPTSQPEPEDILLVPGGWGTRTLAQNPVFLKNLNAFAKETGIIMSVCTGSALLAAAGLLRDKSATSNKQAWDWVISQDPSTHWKRRARWTVDGNTWTSSGVSAGIDMALAFVARQHGEPEARQIAIKLEYIRNQNSDIDPFSS